VLKFHKFSEPQFLSNFLLITFRDEKQQLLLGLRRANRQQPALSSSVISSDSMHIGILAAAAHAAANNSPFTIYYNPRYYLACMRIIIHDMEWNPLKYL
jgi:hypothetical protein